LGQVYTSYVDTIASLLVLPSARYGRPSSSNSVAESFPLPFFISIVDFWRELFPHYVTRTFLCRLLLSLSL